MTKSHISERSIVMLTADRSIDRRILNQAESLRMSGWHVEIVAMPHQDDGGSGSFSVRRVELSRASSGRARVVAHVAAWVRAHVMLPTRLHAVLRTFAWKYLVDQGNFYRALFAPALAGLSPSIYVAHDLPMLLPALDAARQCGAKTVFDSHELYSEQDLSPIEARRWKEIEAANIGACDMVITVNRSIAAELESRYQLPRVQVIQNAEKSAHATSAQRLFHRHFGLPETTKVLLYQGGLSDGRNLDNLVAAMAQVRNRSVVLVMLGDGPRLGNLQRLVRARELGSRVLFHAAVPREELLAFTGSADAGIIPYQATCLNNYYCTPNKLYEFVAAAVPILASDLPELRRVVMGEEFRGRQVGLVANLGAPSEIAARIDSFFENALRVEEWRVNVRALARTLCWEEEQKSLVRLYETLT